MCLDPDYAGLDRVSSLYRRRVYCYCYFFSVISFATAPQSDNYLGAAGVVLIWKTAPGSSLDSACTVALIPMAARAPRRIPQGNQRNYTRWLSLGSMSPYVLWMGGVGPNEREKEIRK